MGSVPACALYSLQILAGLILKTSLAVTRFKAVAKLRKSH